MWAERVSGAPAPLKESLNKKFEAHGERKEENCFDGSSTLPVHSCQHIAVLNFEADKMATKKHKTFVNEPIGMKEVDKIPGIRVTAKVELQKIKITRASQVLGYYLTMEREQFCEWLQQFDANKGNQKACYEALKEFCDYHIY